MGIILAIAEVYLYDVESIKQLPWHLPAFVTLMRANSSRTKPQDIMIPRNYCNWYENGIIVICQDIMIPRNCCNWY